MTARAWETLLECERHTGVVEITFNRSDCGNAFDILSDDVLRRAIRLLKAALNGIYRPRAEHLTEDPAPATKRNSAKALPASARTASRSGIWPGSPLETRSGASHDRQRNQQY